MSESPSNPYDADAEDLSRLAAGIAQLEARRADVPAEIDDAMHEAIRAHFADPVRFRRRWRIGYWSIGGGFAAAATLMLVALVEWNARTPPTSPSLAQSPVVPHAPVAPLQIPGDVDASGRIDVLDALALARKLESPHEFASEQVHIFDLNVDGQVDRRDVDAIAMRAVAINQPAVGGRSS